MKYFTELHLSGYKSIKDVTVKLHPGINIFIGPNGSGKSNLLTFIHHLSDEYPKLDDEYSCRISWISDTNLYVKRIDKTVSIDSNTSDIKDLMKNTNVRYEYHISENGIEIIYFEGNPLTGSYHFEEGKGIEPYGLEINPITLIPFRFDETIDFLNKNKTLTLTQYDVFKLTENRSPVSKMLAASFWGFRDRWKNISIEEINNTIYQSSRIIVDVLKKYSPINDLKLTEAVSLNTDPTNSVVENILFKFQLSDGWFSWDDLSDGTKRIVDIIFKVFDAMDVVLIEEPELGIHPHQLSRLLEFLKEQSKEKQILISTHSPEVLDVLGMNELDHINLVSIKNGSTEVKKLTAKQKKKAKDYFEVSGSLGDYWKHSDLEV